MSRKSRNSFVAAGWRRGAELSASTLPVLSLWGSMNSSRGEISWPAPSGTQLWKSQEVQHGETCSTTVLLLWDQQQRSSQAEAPELWMFTAGDASTVHDCFQEEWKPWRCPADVWRSHSCYLLTGSLGSCWAQSKVSPGTRQMMNLGCKILCAPLPFWPVILYHMSSGLQIPKKQQFATLDL